MKRRKHSRLCPALPRSRNGLTSLEIVVSAGILLATLSLLTTLTFKCGRIWRDISTHRLAVKELSSQMEVLTLMKREDVADRLGQLELSPVCRERLKDVAISGKLSDDNLGVRLVLELNWDRGHDSLPVTLAGWLMDAEAKR